MSDLEKDFKAAVDKVRSAPPNGPFKPSNELRLRFYGLYRQASDGDVSGKRPGVFDMINRMKYDAWAKLQGMPREEAMKQYIAEVDKVERQLG